MNGAQIKATLRENTSCDSCKSCAHGLQTFLVTIPDGAVLHAPGDCLPLTGEPVDMSRVETSHLTIANIIQTYAARLVRAYPDERKTIIEERDVLLAWADKACLPLTAEGTARLARLKLAFTVAVNAPSVAGVGLAVPHWQDVERIWTAITASPHSTALSAGDSAALARKVPS